MADLSTQPYKGSRDFYPEEMRLERYIFDIWRTVAERYGYEEYTAPMLELTDIYRAKTGEEIVSEQIYSFQDRGGRDVTIRPEMTPSLARLVANRYQELAWPLRLYSIPNLWRYERPQKGRLREHWQLNVDLFGVEAPDGEFEMIQLASDLMSEFGASEEMYTIKLNSRTLLAMVLGEYLKLNIDETHQITRLLDKRTKLENKAFVNQAAAILEDKLDKFLEVIDTKKLAEMPKEIASSEAAEELLALGAMLVKAGIKNVELDLGVVRGFDYYTGIVFEVFDTDPDNNRSLFGGGRYDELLALFKVKPLPTIGFGMGDATLLEFLRTHELLPELSTSVDAYIAVLEPQFRVGAYELATQLRSEGVAVAVDPTDRRAGAKTKTADRQGVPYVIYFGESEAGSNEITVKQLSSGEERKLTRDKLADYLKQSGDSHQTLLE